MRHPQAFGRYGLLERVSIGGMAEVFKARPLGGEGNGKILAIKRILPSMAEDSDFIKMFIDEARISGQLHHPNIAEIYELGRVDNAHFIAMEFVWGKDLLQIQNRFRRHRQRMRPEMAAFVASRIAAGLDYAHRKTDAAGKLLGIIHRDVSPQNILISYEGEVKVIDFGIAKAASRSTRTQAGVLKGKFGYMSPEQVRGQTLDHRADIFSIATILYEMLIAERLFLGDSDFATLEKVKNVDVPPPSKVCPACPAELERIILKGLASEPAARYQWASEMQAELEAFCSTCDPSFSTDRLSQWMKSQFVIEMRREATVLEEQARIDLSSLSTSGAPLPLLPSIDGTPVPGTAPALTPPSGNPVAPQPDIGDVPYDELPGEATQISISEVASSAGAAAETPLSAEATRILDQGSGSSNPRQGLGDLSAQSTVILDTGHAEGLPSQLGQATMILPTPVAPAPGPTARAAPVNPPHVAAPRAPRPETDFAAVLPRPPARSASWQRDVLIGVVVALVLIGAILGGRQLIAQRKAAASGTLVVTLVPPSAGVVFLDGNEGGRVTAAAAVTLRSVSAGEHLLSVRSEQGSYSSKVTVIGGDVTVVQAVLRREPSVEAPPAPPPPSTPANPASNAPGRLRLIIRTPGVRVLIDSVEIDEQTWKNEIPLHGGVAHTLVVAREGYEEFRLPFTLEPGKVLEQTIELRPDLADLTIESTPSGADVRVDGHSAGQTPLHLDRLDPARAVRVTVGKRGFKSVSKQVRFDGDRHPKLTLELVAEGTATGSHRATPPTPAPPSGPKPTAASSTPPSAPPADENGYLIANTQPWARVWIDGKDTGKTTPIAPRSKIPLKPGTHTVTFMANGRSYNFEITIKAGQDAKLVKQLADAP